jgi:two-component system response regulator HydG
MKAGAYDYVTKPFGMEELKLLLARVSDQFKVKTERRMLAEQNKSIRGFGSIIGRAPEMQRLNRIIGKAAHTAHPVLILGESGTGKEMVARQSILPAHFVTNLLCLWTAGLLFLR